MKKREEKNPGVDSNWIWRSWPMLKEERKS